MEAKEAIERINDHIMVHRIYEPRSIRISDALEIAKKALKKQIPEKPMPLSVYFICPVCGSAVEYPFEYCRGCGQAIDWEGE